MSDKEFQCPSCSAQMAFGGGESIFQTCDTCHAPIVIPSEIFYPPEKQITATNFATLNNDIPVDPEQVTNELTPGDNPPTESEVIDPEAKIEKFEIYQEKIGTQAAAGKKIVDNIIAPDKDFSTRSQYDSLIDAQVNDDAQNVLDRVKHELRTGDKIEAIKIYREAHGLSLAESKKLVEAVEREEIIKSKVIRKPTLQRKV